MVPVKHVVEDRNLDGVRAMEVGFDSPPLHEESTSDGTLREVQDHPTIFTKYLMKVNGSGLTMAC